MVSWGDPNRGIDIAITLPFDGKPATIGNGSMAAIGAKDRVRARAIGKSPARNI